MYYVTMIDKFMSGWGKSEGKSNKLVIECETLKQAMQIEEAARKRDEMKYIRVTSSAPRINYRTQYPSYYKYEEMTGWH